MIQFCKYGFSNVLKEIFSRDFWVVTSMILVIMSCMLEYHCTPNYQKHCIEKIRYFRVYLV